MRCGFLNASPSETPVPSFDKGSRNKRKFRTDHHHQHQHQSVSTSSPLSPSPASSSSSYSCSSSSSSPSPSSVSCDVSKTLAPRTTITSPNLDLNNRDSAQGSTTCCNGGHSMVQLNHVNIDVPDSTLHASDNATLQLSYSKHNEEASHESDWDRFCEAQLEEILMNALDALYKGAIKKLTSWEYSHEDALNAVLRNGRWTGCDALASVVDNSLTWLQNREARISDMAPIFSDLIQMENYVLAEMVCMLRKVKPHLCKGDAMWLLVMCDLNVYLACTMEDSVPSSNKDSDVHNPAQSQTAVSGRGLSTTSAGIITTHTSPLPLVSAQPSTLHVNSRKDTGSAFSTPKFPSSLVSKVAVTCRKGVSRSSISRNTHTITTSTNSEAVNLTQEHSFQCMAVVNSHQVSLPQIPALEEHATNLGLYSTQCHNKCQHIDKVHSTEPDHFAASVSLSHASSQKIQMGQVANTPSVPQFSAVAELSSLSGTRLSLQHECTVSNANARNNAYGTHPQTDKQLRKSELRIGKPNDVQVSNSDSWLASTVCRNDSNTSSATELSLATSSLAVSMNRIVNNGTIHVNHTSQSSPYNTILGCVDVNCKEQKTVMIWQLVDRVKNLESQLQRWTDWAQEKIMQAARRLTKDAAELKALRQERDEFIRLKKEKQTLEESTMKKLAEMENALCKALNQVDRANSTAWRLESENKEVRAQMEAAKLAAAESVSECQEAAKREKKSSKRAQGWEKQKLKLQEELIEGKRNLSSLFDQLAQAKERLQQTEVRWRQEKRAKEESLAMVEKEMKAKEQVELSLKRREEELQRKSESESRRHCDEVKKLEKEIAKVKLSLGLQPTTLSWANDIKIASSNLDAYSPEKLKQMHGRLLSEIAELKQPQADLRRDRECIMCLTEEMTVVFLPCAHQVVCTKCDDLHQKRGLRDCPSCRTPIQRRIQVYGVRS